MEVAPQVRPASGFAELAFSGKQAWVDAAFKLVDSAEFAWDTVQKQTETIRDLSAEIELLQKQIETRKPKGGKPRVSDAKVRAIEVELEAGHSKRSIAARHRVSAMTVVRIGKRMKARSVS